MKRSERILLDCSSATGVLTATLADFPITTMEKLRFADTDRNGHTTNTVFAVCCQNARMELLCDPERVPIPCNSQFVIAKLLLEFGAEMHWPGTVEIGTRVERIGRCSATLDQALFVRDCCVAIAQSVVVLMCTMTRQSMVLPTNTAQALRLLLDRIMIERLADALLSLTRPARNTTAQVSETEGRTWPLAKLI